MLQIPPSYTQVNNNTNKNNNNNNNNNNNSNINNNNHLVYPCFSSKKTPVSLGGNRHLESSQTPLPSNSEPRGAKSKSDIFDTPRFPWQGGVEATDHGSPPITTWVFPKNRGTPKGMVYNGKPY